MIQAALAEKASVVLLTTRKGLAPVTACSDCGTIITCPVCETPLTLHKKNAPGRIYMCHHCMHTTEPIDTCASCGSWRLTGLGIATDTIFDEVKKLFPKAHIAVSDGDTTKTISATKKAIQFWEEKGGILIATPMVIPFITTIPYGCLVSMDSLLSLPSYTSSEQALVIALSFLEKISRGAILQTRTIDHDVIRAIHHENIFDFVKEELATRKQFHYPPFNILLKVSLETKKDTAREATAHLETIFKGYDPDILLKRSTKAHLVIAQAVMKIDPTLWNDPTLELHVLLKALGPAWKKEVNSTTLF
jgi:primosomal protein N' (replication factor Y)